MFHIWFSLISTSNRCVFYNFVGSFFNLQVFMYLLYVHDNKVNSQAILVPPITYESCYKQKQVDVLHTIETQVLCTQPTLNLLLFNVL